MELHYHKLASNGMKQLMVTLVTEGSCPPVIGPTLVARFALSLVYHSQSQEWLMLWVYGGGQKTQLNQFLI